MRNAFAMLLRPLPWMRRPRVHQLLCVTGALPAPCRVKVEHKGNAAAARHETDENMSLSGDQKSIRLSSWATRSFTRLPAPTRLPCGGRINKPTNLTLLMGREQRVPLQGCAEKMYLPVDTAPPQRPVAEEWTGRARCWTGTQGMTAPASMRNPGCQPNEARVAVADVACTWTGCAGGLLPSPMLVSRPMDGLLQ